MGDLRRCIDNVMRSGNYKGIALVCIGTDRCTGDSFGALVGSIAKERKLEDDYDVIVIGDLDNPIHAVNINDYIEEINSLYGKYVVIAVDASVTTDKDNIGNLYVKPCGLNPGLGVGKELPYIGDICICYNAVYAERIEALNSVRLSRVFNMANKTVDLIQEYLEEHKNNVPIRAEVLIDKTGSITLHDETYLLPDVAFVVEVLRGLVVRGKEIRNEDFVSGSLLFTAYRSIYGRNNDVEYIRNKFKRSLYRLVGKNIRISAVRDHLNNRRRIDGLFKTDLYRLHREKILYIMNHPEDVYWEGSNYRVDRGRHRRCGGKITELRMIQAD